MTAEYGAKTNLLMVVRRIYIPDDFSTSKERQSFSNFFGGRSATIAGKVFKVEKISRSKVGA
jgi:hypothetical protein